MPEKTGSERSAFALTTSETVAEDAPSPSETRVAVSVALVWPTGSATTATIGSESSTSGTSTRRITVPSPPRPPVEL